jgi:imidazolonepropionase-like amidohydrolase
MRKLFVLALIILLPVQFFCQPAARPPKDLAFTNITIIDMTGAPPKKGMTVVISGNRIVWIGRTSRANRPKDARIFDGTGKFLVPAFWDMHVHALNSDRMLPLFVANGVLGIRDMGNPHIEDILRWRDEAAKEKIVSPRIITAGRVIDGDPPANRDYSVVVKNAVEARKAVQDLLAQKVDLFKVYDHLPREAYFAIADEAKKSGVPFAGHIPSAITSIEASDAGQKSIEHLGMTLEESSGQPEKIRAARAVPIKEGDFFAFTTRLAHVYDETFATYSKTKAREIFAHFRKNKTWQVPTLTVKKSRTFIDELDAKGDPRSKYVEASQREYWKPKVGFFSRYRSEAYILAQYKYFQKERELVGEMQRQGVPLLAGTDTPGPYVIAGFSLHDELALLVNCGLTPMEALVAATRSPAEYLGELKSQGTVQTGKAANLIVLDADPLKDITNTTRINSVIQNGRYLSRAELDKILADVEAAASKK